MRAMLRYRAGGRGERAAVLVEFALVFPLLIMLILGMVTAGLAYNQKLQITHATREGARFAATVSPIQTFANGESWARNVRDLVVERSAGDLVDAQVCVSLVEGSPGTVYDNLPGYSTLGGTTPCIPNQQYPLAGTDDGLRAQVTVARQGSIELVVFDDITFTMSSKATAKSEATG
jgi:Flp pilus assembly protein TadG